MSTFVVVTAEGSSDAYGKGARYYFNQHGLLVTVRADGQRRTYAPAAWLYLDDVENGDRPDLGVKVH